MKFFLTEEYIFFHFLNATKCIFLTHYRTHFLYLNPGNLKCKYDYSNATNPNRLLSVFAFSYKCIAYYFIMTFFPMMTPFCVTRLKTLNLSFVFYRDFCVCRNVKTPFDCIWMTIPPNVEYLRRKMTARIFQKASPDLVTSLNSTIARWLSPEMKAQVKGKK